MSAVRHFPDFYQSINTGHQKGSYRLYIIVLTDGIYNIVNRFCP